MHIEWDSSEIRRSIVEVSELVGESILWAAGSHDIPRSPTRFGNNDLGRSRTLALNVLFSFLPGVPVIYQGEELGLINGDVPEEYKLDPVALNDNQFGGRDGCRTPMPWGSGSNNGFSETNPWLISKQRDVSETAQAQIGKSESWHSYYKNLLDTRRSLPELTGLDVTWLDNGEGPVIWYERGPVGVIVNTSSKPESVRLGLDSEIVYKTPLVELSESGELRVLTVGAVVYLRG
jgi:alpha-glucosidase